ncbi:carboxypeptidase-like regulatory domain-containing protein [Emticicia sp. BO119]|uniref:carboxypeptidase-like regulatory domain-containing protein n=1 Tax=Emticicia sp. BO119 TaxID=2757768 RepID=UPI0015F08901|nr:carboxypeptidase-like regulatory domain-containing protein [Emticicia sp. BO119]MBA4851710.1 carboxypeptidase-like regulatory domain-containing protein [Emticicia sp. BO119]
MYKLSAKKLLVGICCFFITQMVLAQTKVSGTITDAVTKEPLIGVSVQVKGKVIGTITDTKGNFSFSTSTPPPFTLLITSVGYESQEVNVSGNNAAINISLKEQAILGQEVVVAASRVEETVMKSPVAVEKMDIRAIRESTSPSFYDALANMKGVDMTTQGLLFKSINMRGFGATGNPRTVQMIDGMDNQAPGLNFPVDNIVGMPELDVESVELLPGAASALYGPNAINGLILMNSKSPFLYQGLSATVKTGVMNASNRETVTTPFYDLSLRYAKAFNDKFAFKVNLAYIGAKDWEATNYTNLNVGGLENGTRGAGVDTDYDGMNVYGDEVQANMTTVATGLIGKGLLPAAAAGLIPANTNISRTGYLERDMLDYNTKSFKTNVALHYRINEKVELVGQVNYGYGTTAYTGTGRYSLRNFNLTQAKLELRGDNFTLRTYTTQERSGQSYFSGLTAVNMLNEIKPHETWFGTYVGAFVQARSAGQAEAQAHLAARAAADQGMPQPGTAAYDALLDKYREKAIVDGGGAFLDKTNLYHTEGVYNFKNQVKFIDLLAGANYRVYQLRSNGTLFADQKDGRNGTININEYGAFLQAAKSLFGDHFKLTASIRYDKNQNFDGQFTPRVSGVASFGDHNIRLSYQSGFRIPTTQNQYIDLKTPAGTLIGGLPEFNARYNLSNGISLAVLNDFQANPLKYITADVVAKAQAYATQAVTAQATPAITAGVNAAILQQVTAGVTAAITQQVTAGVTAQVNAAVQAGQIPPEAAAAAIQAGVAQTLPGALAQNLQPGIDAQLPGAIAANFQAAFNAELQKVLVANVPGVTQQVTPAFALATLPKYSAKTLQPERIQSVEIGYKGLIGKKLFVDAYYYTSTYRNFIGGVSVVVPTAAAGPGLPIESGVSSATTRLGYSRPANTSEKIKVNGWALGLNYSLTKGFFINANIANNELKRFVPSAEQQYAGFNTPDYRYNLGFGKRIGSGDKFGFNINFKHQNAFLWQASFNQPTTTGTTFFSNTTVPAINNLDAQVSMKLPAMKSIIKLGGTNIGGKPYIQAYGSALIGSMYYVALSFDELLNK